MSESATLERSAAPVRGATFGARAVDWLSQYAAFGAIVVTLLVAAVVAPAFFSAGNLRAVLIQTAETGLTMINANPYIYPLVVSVIIFVAVLVDSRRTEMLEQLELRQIRVET